MRYQRDRTNSLTRTEIHDVLRNDRRRRVIELLSDDNPRTLRSLADEIAAAEAGGPPAPRSVRQSVYVTLHQNHLPKLDSLNVVDYDDTSKNVALDECASELSAYVQRTEPEWGGFRTGVVVFGLAATLASYTAVPLFASLDPGVYAIVAFVLLLISLSAQLIKRAY